MIQAKYCRVHVNAAIRFDFADRKYPRAPVFTDGQKYEIDRVLEV